MRTKTDKEIITNLYHNTQRLIRTDMRISLFLYLNKMLDGNHSETFNFSATASAHRSPSIPAETIPPA